MNSSNRISLHAKIVFGGFLFGIAFVLILGAVITNQDAGAFLFDAARGTYPFTIQNLMWLVFFAGLADLYVHYRRGSRESAQLHGNFLPEDDQTMLRSEDLGVIFKRLREAPGPNPGEQYFLERLATRSILQFQSSRSVDQANSILNSSLELYQHEIDLRYNMIRYVTWLIPTLGFIGTVIGIAMALGDAGNLDFGNPQAGMLAAVTDKLGVAFYTTLLALLQSAVLVFFQQIAQAREEMALNKAGQYCLDNLINRLFEK